MSEELNILSEALHKCNEAVSATSPEAKNIINQLDQDGIPFKVDSTGAIVISHVEDDMTLFQSRVSAIAAKHKYDIISSDEGIKMIAMRVVGYTAESIAHQFKTLLQIAHENK
jgi:hypothetical protein